MAFDIIALAKVAKAYGAKLYKIGADHGAMNGKDVSLSDDGENILVPDGQGGEFYVRIDDDSVVAGLDLAKSHFVLYEIVALRDGNGEYNGKPWSVAKGDVRFRMRSVAGLIK